MLTVLPGIYIGVELLDSMATLFKLSRNCYTVLQRSGTILHSHQYVRVPMSLHPHQQLLLSFIIAILVGVRYYLIVVLIPFSLMSHDDENLIM